MPIYEYYCPDNHRIYSFFAKTLAQGRTMPPCPDNPAYRMVKIVSSFAVTGRARKTGEQIPDTGKGGMGTEGPGGDPENPYGPGGEAGAKPPADPKEARSRLRARRGPPLRDPKLYDYE